ncbi:hypothetical protein PAXRUDRAFT_824359 [Paxillus rubicundulus Ve08.2h10]|uniref:Uncharacterized protein n=1 Tax=Paxillus rubicundulus Ve08.2h10 TaxID=930991 RepID=A0A0D0E7X2_9AGAM|nr:hypothetical protein PAXRUDRAFT_824359 [Paxillus rubicundulus Ve08.2h10]
MSYGTIRSLSQFLPRAAGRRPRSSRYYVTSMTPRLEPMHSKVSLITIHRIWVGFVNWAVT